MPNPEFQPIYYVWYLTFMGFLSSIMGFCRDGTVGLANSMSGAVSRWVRQTSGMLSPNRRQRISDAGVRLEEGLTVTQSLDVVTERLVDANKRRAVAEQEAQEARDHREVMADQFVEISERVSLSDQTERELELVSVRAAARRVRRARKALGVSQPDSSNIEAEPDSIDVEATRGAADEVEEPVVEIRHPVLRDLELELENQAEDREFTQRSGNQEDSATPESSPSRPLRRVLFSSPKSTFLPGVGEVRATNSKVFDKIKKKKRRGQPQ